MDTPVISTVRLARRYAGRWALRGVDLRVERGRALMIFGSNGSGKTTLIRLLGTALRPTSGRIELFGRAPEDDGVRARVAMLSHVDHHYDDLSALENLELAASLGPPRAGDPIEQLRAVGLEDRAGDLVRSFSAGMRKRLAFARLLWKRAELVLLDEPYAGMDPAGQALVDTLIGSLRATGTTVVLSTHQVDRGAGLCDEAVLLRAGRATWTGQAADAAKILVGET